MMENDARPWEGYVSKVCHHTEVLQIGKKKKRLFRIVKRFKKTKKVLGRVLKDLSVTRLVFF